MKFFWFLLLWAKIIRDCARSMFPICVQMEAPAAKEGCCSWISRRSRRRKKNPILGGRSRSLSSLSLAQLGAVCARLLFALSLVAVPSNTPARAPEMGRKVGRGACVVAKKEEEKISLSRRRKKKKVGRSVGKEKKKGVRLFWVSGFLGCWWWLVWAAAGRAKGRTIRHTQAEGRCCATPEKQKGGRGRQEK